MENKKFEIYGKLVLDVSMDVEGENHDVALKKAIETLDDNVELYELVLKTTGGKVVKLKIHNVENKWKTVFSEDE